MARLGSCAAPDLRPLETAHPAHLLGQQLGDGVNLASCSPSGSLLVLGAQQQRRAPAAWLVRSLVAWGSLRAAESAGQPPTGCASTVAPLVVEHAQQPTLTVVTLLHRQGLPRLCLPVPQRQQPWRGASGPPRPQPAAVCAPSRGPRVATPPQPRRAAARRPRCGSSPQR